MEIVKLSSYPPRVCGIATYTRDLKGGLESTGINVTVISHADSVEQPEEDESDIKRVIRLSDPTWHDIALEAIPDGIHKVVHAQHEFGIWNNGDNNAGFLEFLKLLHKDRTPLVVTNHTIYRKISGDMADYYSKQLAVVDATIFHCQYQKDCLPDNIPGIPQELLDKIHIIPHGVRTDVNFTEERSRELLEEILQRKGDNISLEGRPIVTMAGRWGDNKRFDLVIDYWHEVQKEIPEALLIVAGDIATDAREQKNIKAKILASIGNSGARESILYLPEVLPTNVGHMVLYSASRVVVLPYDEESQSGDEYK